MEEPCESRSLLPKKQLWVGQFLVLCLPLAKLGRCVGIDLFAQQHDAESELSGSLAYHNDFKALYVHTHTQGTAVLPTIVNCM